jgi:hypothetical protein
MHRPQVYFGDVIFCHMQSEPAAFVQVKYSSTAWLSRVSISTGDGGAPQAQSVDRTEPSTCEPAVKFVVSMIAFRGSVLFSLAMGQPTIVLLLELTLCRDMTISTCADPRLTSARRAIAVLTSKNAHDL